MFGFFKILFKLELFAKIKKDLVSTHSQKPGFFAFLLITQNLSKIKNRKHVQNFRKILNFMAVGARQSFQFFRQITWFLGYDTSLSKFR